MNEANELLMMFIVDGYKTTHGKITRKTALAMMKYVASDEKLTNLVCNSDYKAILKHEVKEL